MRRTQFERLHRETTGFIDRNLRVAGTRLIRRAAVLLISVPLAGTASMVSAQAAVPAASFARQTQPAVQATPPSPAQLFGPLYRDVEMTQVFADSKTFADQVPNAPPAQILADYEHMPSSGSHDPRTHKEMLSWFVAQHFSAPVSLARPYTSDPKQSVTQHIDTLWAVLRRNPDTTPPRYSSQLPTDRPYIVPGGRFNEIYYWDSYFIMLGLEASGRHDLARDELANFAALIDRYGHIPNGTRTYYLSRSQPPFFAQMVTLVARRDGDATYLRYLPQLRREYDYWMAGADTLKPGTATRHVVRLADGTLLNRYWDALDTPRDESYREDVLTAQQAPQRASAELWRDLRAAAESGWDFSSRWLADEHTLSSIETTSLIPVDLNALLVNLEYTLAKAYGLQGNAREAQYMAQQARLRANAINRILWDPQLHAYGDYDFAHRTLTHRLTAATVYPLYFGVATRTQAYQVAGTLRTGLLRPGGLATTQVASGQQWDEPNGWAPLQYLAVVGLRRYGEQALAHTIATRWIDTNLAGYQRTHKLVEKYDVDAAPAAASAAGGGEYPTQDGFGWTNGVLRALMEMYPHAASPSVSPMSTH